MALVSEPGCKAFISYSHEGRVHLRRVLSLSERLREGGVDAQVDQYIQGAPIEGWQRWMLDQIERAHHVLVVCTKRHYRRFRGHDQPGVGKGADWEGGLITQELYDAGSKTVKFIPVVFKQTDRAFIPEPLRKYTCYDVGRKAGYDRLYDFLLGQAGVEPKQLGTLRRKSRALGRTVAFELETPDPPTGNAATAALLRTRLPAILAANHGPPRPLLLRAGVAMSHCIGRSVLDQWTYVCDSCARAGTQGLIDALRVVDQAQVTTFSDELSRWAAEFVEAILGASPTGGGLPEALHSLKAFVANEESRWARLRHTVANMRASSATVDLRWADSMWSAWAVTNELLSGKAHRERQRETSTTADARILAGAE